MATNNKEEEQEQQEQVDIWTNLDGINIFDLQPPSMEVSEMKLFLLPSPSNVLSVPSMITAETTKTKTVLNVGNITEILLKFKCMSERQMSPLDMTYDNNKDSSIKNNNNTDHDANDESSTDERNTKNNDSRHNDETIEDWKDDEFYDGTGNLVWLAAQYYSQVIFLLGSSSSSSTSGRNSSCFPSCLHEGSNLCELGCGTGVAGIATLLWLNLRQQRQEQEQEKKEISSTTVTSKKLSSSSGGCYHHHHLVFTDNDRESLDLCLENCHLNDILSFSDYRENNIDDSDTATTATTRTKPRTGKCTNDLSPCFSHQVLYWGEDLVKLRRRQEELNLHQSQQGNDTTGANYTSDDGTTAASNTKNQTPSTSPSSSSLFKNGILLGPSTMDIVIATDVVYDIQMVGPLMDTASALLHVGGYLILSHVPRFCYLPDKNDNDNEMTTGPTRKTTTMKAENNDADTINAFRNLELYIEQQAKNVCLHLVESIRPDDILQHVESTLCLPRGSNKNIDVSQEENQQQQQQKQQQQQANDEYYIELKAFLKQCQDIHAAIFIFEKKSIR